VFRPELELLDRIDPEQTVLSGWCGRLIGLALYPPERVLDFFTKLQNGEATGRTGAPTPGCRVERDPADDAGKTGGANRVASGFVRAHVARPGDVAGRPRNPAQPVLVETSIHAINWSHYSPN